MKLSLNGALTIGTEDGANIELHQAITSEWWPFSFGGSAEENEHLREYRGWDIYNSDKEIREALDTLKDDTFAESEEEHTAFSSLRNTLLDRDHYLVLRDLRSYYETQKKVEELYRTPQRWAECALHNIAGSGFFSSDRAIDEYASNIWELEKCRPSEAIFAHVRKEYFEHDRCHIV
jgi:starch phosphorylase